VNAPQALGEHIEQHGSAAFWDGLKHVVGTLAKDAANAFVPGLGDVGEQLFSGDSSRKRKPKRNPNAKPKPPRAAALGWDRY
jgi:hypothetical protein